MTHHFLGFACKEALLVVEGDPVDELALGLGIEDDLESVAANDRHLDPFGPEIKSEHEPTRFRQHAHCQADTKDCEEDGMRAHLRHRHSQVPRFPSREAKRRRTEMRSLLSCSASIVQEMRKKRNPFRRVFLST